MLPLHFKMSEQLMNGRISSTTVEIDARQKEKINSLLQRKKELIDICASPHSLMAWIAVYAILVGSKGYHQDESCHVA